METTVGCPFSSVQISDSRSTVTVVAHKAFTSSRLTVSLLHTWPRPEGDGDRSYLTGGQTWRHEQGHTIRAQHWLGPKREVAARPSLWKACSVSPQGDGLSKRCLPYSLSNLAWHLEDTVNRCIFKLQCVSFLRQTLILLRVNETTFVLCKKRFRKKSIWNSLKNTLGCLLLNLFGELWVSKIFFQLKGIAEDVFSVTFFLYNLKLP